MIKPQKDLKSYILEYFELYDTAHITDLFNYILIEKNDFVNYEIFEDELMKSVSEKLIRIKEDVIYKIEDKLDESFPFDYEFGDYNFVINAEIENIDNINRYFEKIAENLDGIKFDFKKYDFLPNFSIEKEGNRELFIEFISDEWEGTISLRNKSFEICTLLKKTEFLIDWEKYIENNFTPNDEIYRSLPSSGHALFLYKLIKSVITKSIPTCKLKIICAEFRKSQ